MNLLPFAFSFAEWQCLDDDGVNAPVGCRQKVRWQDAVIVEQDGRMVAVLHRDCVQ